MSDENQMVPTFSFSEINPDNIATIRAWCRECKRAADHLTVDAPLDIRKVEGRPPPDSKRPLTATVKCHGITESYYRPNAREPWKFEMRSRDLNFQVDNASMSISFNFHMSEGSDEALQKILKSMSGSSD